MPLVFRMRINFFALGIVVKYLLLALGRFKACFNGAVAHFEAKLSIEFLSFFRPPNKQSDHVPNDPEVSFDGKVDAD